MGMAFLGQKATKNAVSVALVVKHPARKDLPKL